METLGERVKRLREERGLSAARLGSLAGIGEGAVFKIESGATKQPEFVTGTRLAKALGVSAGYLAGIERASTTTDDLQERGEAILEGWEALNESVQHVLEVLGSAGLLTPNGPARLRRLLDARQ